MEAKSERERHPERHEKKNRTNDYEKRTPQKHSYLSLDGEMMISPFISPIHDYSPPKLKQKMASRILRLDQEEDGGDAEEKGNEETTTSTRTSTKRASDNEIFLFPNCKRRKQEEDSIISSCCLQSFFDKQEMGNLSQSSRLSFLPPLSSIKMNHITNIKGRKRQQLTPRKLLLGSNPNFWEGFILPKLLNPLHTDRNGNDEDVLYHSAFCPMGNEMKDQAENRLNYIFISNKNL